MKNFYYKCLFLILIAFSYTSFCQKNTEQFSKIDSIISNAIIDTAFPGAVVLIWKDGKVIFNKGFGQFTYDDSSPKVTTETLYDLASLTKVIATTTAAMICLDRKFFSLEDKVSSYIPEFSVNGKEEIKIKNLLLHNSGLPAWKKFYELCSSEEEVLIEIFSSQLEYETGTRTLYSDLGFITLGKIIEKVSGKSLDHYCKDEIFGPLNMKSTLFSPDDSIKGICAPTEIDNYWRMKMLQGQVHDETSAMLNGVAGHAGLFSTASDIAKLVSILLQKGKYNDKTFIRSATVEMFTARYAPESSRALGWDTKSETGSSAGNLFSMKSFGHTGFTGTSVWADPEKNLFVVFLTNRVYPTRENSKLSGIRPKLHNTVLQEMGYR